MPTATPETLRIAILADKENQVREVKYDPDTGEKKLVDPTTPGDDHSPYPFAGIQIVDENQQPADPPKATRVSTSFVSKGLTGGYVSLEGEQPIFKPAGPPDNPWMGQPPHVFLQAETIVLHTVDGDVRYTVTHQPDKYDDTDEPSGTRVDWFYDLKLES